MNKLPLFLSLISLVSVLSLLPVHGTATPPGLTFDHMVVIAMENQNYGSVIGSSNAPFINNNLTGLGTVMSAYHSYGQNINSGNSRCSAGCYAALFGGNTLGSLCTLSNSSCTAGTSGCSSTTYCDGYCARANSPCIYTRTLIHDFSANSLTWKAYCEAGTGPSYCPRGADHFPYISFQESWNSCVTSFSTCAGPNLYSTTPSILGTFSSASDNVEPTAFNEMNSQSPANFIWLTPSDAHNMHGPDSTVSQGDWYLRSLLVGTGNVTHPASGSLLSSNLFVNPNFRTVLNIWWDEYDPSPNFIFGNGIKVNYVSSQPYNEFYSAHTIERNWGLPYTTSVVSGDTSLTDIFVPTLVATGPGSVIQCDTCTRHLTYTLATVDLSGTATYSSNAPGTVVFTPLSGTQTMALDGSLVVDMAWTVVTCGTGQITTTFTVNGVQRQVSSHVNCATKPNP